METATPQFITGFDLCDAYELDWREVPFVMYSCQCTLNARWVGLTGDLEQLDPNHPKKYGKLYYFQDGFYNLHIFVCSFLNKNHGQFYSDSFVNEFNKMCKNRYGFLFDDTKRISEKIARYVAYSCLIDKAQSVVLLDNNSFKFVKNNNSICIEDVNIILSKSENSFKNQIEAWKAHMNDTSLSKKDKKAIQAIIYKYKGFTHKKVYDSLFPDKKDTKPETKITYVKSLKENAQRLSEKFNLALPPWNSKE